MKKLIITLIIFFVSFNSVYAQIPYFLNFKLILNESNAGKKAQDYLKNKLSKGLKSLKDKEKKILEEEKTLIQQKKILSSEINTVNDDNYLAYNYEGDKPMNGSKFYGDVQGVIYGNNKSIRSSNYETNDILECF